MLCYSRQFQVFLALKSKKRVAALMFPNYNTSYHNWTSLGFACGMIVKPECKKHCTLRRSDCACRNGYSCDGRSCAPGEYPPVKHPLGHLPPRSSAPRPVVPHQCELMYNVLYNVMSQFYSRILHIVGLLH